MATFLTQFRSHARQLYRFSFIDHLIGRVRDELGDRVHHGLVLVQVVVVTAVVVVCVVLLVVGVALGWLSVVDGVGCKEKENRNLISFQIICKESLCFVDINVTSFSLYINVTSFSLYMTGELESSLILFILLNLFRTHVKSLVPRAQGDP